MQNNGINYKVVFVGTSKAGKSTFITGCLNENICQRLSMIIKENNTGQTKIRANYILDFNCENAEAKIARIEIMPYDKLISAFLENENENKDIEDDNYDEDEFEKKRGKTHLKPNIPEKALEMLKNLNLIKADENSLISEKDYDSMLEICESTSVDGFTTLFVERYPNISHDIEAFYNEILNALAYVDIIKSVTIRSLPSEKLISINAENNYNISSIELVDTRGINDVTSEGVKKLEKFNEPVSLEDKEIQLTQDDINKVKGEYLKEYVETEFGIKNADACICMYAEDSITGEPGKAFLNLLGEIAKSMPVIMIQNNEILDMNASTAIQGNGSFNQDNYRDIVSNVIVNRKPFQILSKESICSELKSGSEIIEENFLELLLPKIPGNFPLNNPRYINCHSQVLNILLNMLQDVTQGRDCGKALWEANREYLERLVLTASRDLAKLCALKPEFYLYPNRVTIGYTTNLDYPIGNVLEQGVYIVQGERGGVTPFHRYYSISAISLVTTRFIFSLPDYTYNLIDSNKFDMKEKKAIYNYLKYCALYIEYNGWAPKYYTKYHWSYPRSTNRWYIYSLLEEKNLHTTEAYLQAITEDFLNSLL